MPSSTPERQQRWGLDDKPVVQHLEERGYVLHQTWDWTHPTQTLVTMPEEDFDAIVYLKEEFDYGTFVDPMEAPAVAPVG